MSETMRLERVFPFAQDRVWRAISTGALMADWLLPNDFAPVVGHEFTLQSPTFPGWDGKIAARVLVVEPPRQLAYTWVALGVDTVVTLTLAAVPGGTRLVVEQAGFAEDRPQNLMGARQGWGNFLDRLGRQLEGV